MLEDQNPSKRISKLDFPAMLASLLLIIFVILLGYTGRDDSHITYFVADRLASEGKIENYNGDRVEQSSSISFVATLAIAAKTLNVLASQIGPYVSALFLLATLPLTKNLTTHKGLYWLPCLLPSVVYWSLSGMENSFYIFWLLLLISAINRYLTYASTSNNWLILISAISFIVIGTRPEAMIVISCLGASLGVLLFSKPFRLPVFKIVLAMTLPIIAYAALKKVMDLNFFPNPVYVKQKMDFYTRISHSTGFLHQSALDLPSSTFATIVAGIYLAYHIFTNLKKEIDIVVFLCLSIAGIVLSFNLLSGGDWMENGRFLVPCYFFIALALVRTIPKKTARPIFYFCLMLYSIDILLISPKSYGGIALPGKYQFIPKNFEPAEVEFHNVIHARDISFTDKAIDALRKDPREKITIASVQAGLVPYYLFTSELKSKLHFVDLYGLSTNDVHTCFGQWATDPYQDIQYTQNCVNKKFDYIYELDSENWPRMRGLEAAGCREVFKEHIQIEKKPWNKSVETRQFLVRCGNH